MSDESARAKSLLDRIAERIKVTFHGDDRFSISTPFMFTDGDHCGFRVYKLPSGGWVISDKGGVITHAGYAGVDFSSAEYRENFKAITSFFGIVESDGELVIQVRGDEVGDAFFTLAQACIEVSRLTVVERVEVVRQVRESVARSSSERAEMSKRERLGRFAVGLYPNAGWTRRWTDHEVDPAGLHQVDFHGETRKGELFVFGAARKPDFINAALTTYFYRNRRRNFLSIAVVDNEKAPTDDNVALLEEAGAKVVSYGDIATLESLVN